MEFKEYQHIERFGTNEVEGIETGTCYCFPKLDGTNAQLFIRNSEIVAGSRKRELTLEKDNAGFYRSVLEDSQFDGIKKLFKEKQYFSDLKGELRVYGEFLCPHSLRTYKDSAWRKFYVIDVVEEFEDDTYRYLSYDEYKPILEKYDIEYIPYIKIVKNGDYACFLKVLESNNYLIKDGEGVGEGIVIKNYDYKNKYGRITWAKIVTSEFKEKHTKPMGTSTIERQMVEQDIVDIFLTEALIEKTYAKIVTEREGWSSKYIPQLIETIFHDLVVEESYNIIKKLKNPTINYKTLRTLCIIKIKETKKELF